VDDGHRKRITPTPARVHRREVRAGPGDRRERDAPQDHRARDELTRQEGVQILAELRLVLAAEAARVLAALLLQAAREDGGVFHFVTGGILEALKRATDAAGGQDVRLGGGVSTIRQYLQERLVDEMHLAISPVLLGSGEHLLGGIDLLTLGYECAEHVPRAQATHVVLRKRHN
jgi:riboflavin biosynthesis pyrimidine reductase